jgi:hypothetical protein
MVHVIRRTRSWTCVRLFWLGARNPRRVPGAFRFPFGPVRYMDAGAMLSLYREIFWTAAMRSPDWATRP